MGNSYYRDIVNQNNLVSKAEADAAKAQRQQDNWLNEGTYNYFGTQHQVDPSSGQLQSINAPMQVDPRRFSSEGADGLPDEVAWQWNQGQDAFDAKKLVDEMRKKREQMEKDPESQDILNLLKSKGIKSLEDLDNLADSDDGSLDRLYDLNDSQLGKYFGFMSQKEKLDSLKSKAFLAREGYDENTISDRYKYNAGAYDGYLSDDMKATLAASAERYRNSPEGKKRAAEKRAKRNGITQEEALAQMGAGGLPDEAYGAIDQSSLESERDTAIQSAHQEYKANEDIDPYLQQALRGKEGFERELAKQEYMRANPDIVAKNNADLQNKISQAHTNYWDNKDQDIKRGLEVVQNLSKDGATPIYNEDGSINYSAIEQGVLELDKAIAGASLNYIKDAKKNDPSAIDEFILNYRHASDREVSEVLKRRLEGRYAEGKDTFITATTSGIANALEFIGDLGVGVTNLFANAEGSVGEGFKERSQRVEQLKHQRNALLKMHSSKQNSRPGLDEEGRSKEGEWHDKGASTSKAFVQGAIGLIERVFQGDGSEGTSLEKLGYNSMSPQEEREIKAQFGYKDQSTFLDKGLTMTAGVAGEFALGPFKAGSMASKAAVKSIPRAAAWMTAKGAKLSKDASLIKKAADIVGKNKDRLFEAVNKARQANPAVGNTLDLMKNYGNVALDGALTWGTAELLRKNKDATAEDIIAQAATGAMFHAVGEGVADVLGQGVRVARKLRGKPDISPQFAKVRKSLEEAGPFMQATVLQQSRSIAEMAGRHVGQVAAGPLQTRIDEFVRSGDIDKLIGDLGREQDYLDLFMGAVMQARPGLAEVRKTKKDVDMLTMDGFVSEAKAIHEAETIANMKAEREAHYGIVAQRETASPPEAIPEQKAITQSKPTTEQLPEQSKSEPEDPIDVTDVTDVEEMAPISGFNKPVEETVNEDGDTVINLEQLTDTGIVSEPEDTGYSRPAPGTENKKWGLHRVQIDRAFGLRDYVSKEHQTEGELEQAENRTARQEDLEAAFAGDKEVKSRKAIEFNEAFQHQVSEHNLQDFYFTEDHGLTDREFAEIFMDPESFEYADQASTLQAVHTETQQHEKTVEEYYRDNPLEKERESIKDEMFKLESSYEGKRVKSTKAYRELKKKLERIDQLEESGDIENISLAEYLDYYVDSSSSDVDIEVAKDDYISLMMAQKDMIHNPKEESTAKKDKGDNGATQIAMFSRKRKQQKKKKALKKYAQHVRRKAMIERRKDRLEERAWNEKSPPIEQGEVEAESDLGLTKKILDAKWFQGLKGQEQKRIIDAEVRALADLKRFGLEETDIEFLGDIQYDGESFADGMFVGKAVNGLISVVHGGREGTLHHEIFHAVRNKMQGEDGALEQVYQDSVREVLEVAKSNHIVGQKLDAEVQLLKERLGDSKSEEEINQLAVEELLANEFEEVVRSRDEAQGSTPSVKEWIGGLAKKMKSFFNKTAKSDELVAKEAIENLKIWDEIYNPKMSEHAFQEAGVGKSTVSETGDIIPTGGLKSISVGGRALFSTVDDFKQYQEERHEIEQDIHRGDMDEDMFREAMAEAQADLAGLSHILGEEPTRENLEVFHLAHSDKYVVRNTKDIMGFGEESNSSFTRMFVDGGKYHSKPEAFEADFVQRITETGQKIEGDLGDYVYNLYRKLSNYERAETVSILPGENRGVEVVRNPDSFVVGKGIHSPEPFKKARVAYQNMTKELADRVGILKSKGINIGTFNKFLELMPKLKDFEINNVEDQYKITEDFYKPDPMTGVGVADQRIMSMFNQGFTLNNHANKGAMALDISALKSELFGLGAEQGFSDMPDGTKYNPRSNPEHVQVMKQRLKSLADVERGLFIQALMRPEPGFPGANMKKYEMDIPLQDGGSFRANILNLLEFNEAGEPFFNFKRPIPTKDGRGTVVDPEKLNEIAEVTAPLIDEVRKVSSNWMNGFVPLVAMDQWDGRDEPRSLVREILTYGLNQGDPFGEDMEQMLANKAVSLIHAAHLSFIDPSMTFMDPWTVKDDGTAKPTKRQEKYVSDAYTDTNPIDFKTLSHFKPNIVSNIEVGKVPGMVIKPDADGKDQVHRRMMVIDPDMLAELMGEDHPTVQVMKHPDGATFAIDPVAHQTMAEMGGLNPKSAQKTRYRLGGLSIKHAIHPVDPNSAGHMKPLIEWAQANNVSHIVVSSALKNFGTPGTINPEKVTVGSKEFYRSTSGELIGEVGPDGEVLPLPEGVTPLPQVGDRLVNGYGLLEVPLTGRGAETFIDGQAGSVKMKGTGPVFRSAQFNKEAHHTKLNLGEHPQAEKIQEDYEDLVDVIDKYMQNKSATLNKVIKGYSLLNEAGGAKATDEAREAVTDFMGHLLEYVDTEASKNEKNTVEDNLTPSAIPKSTVENIRKVVRRIQDVNGEISYEVDFEQMGSLILSDGNLITSNEGLVPSPFGKAERGTVALSMMRSIAKDVTSLRGKGSALVLRPDIDARGDLDRSYSYLDKLKAKLEKKGKLSPQIEEKINAKIEQLNTFVEHIDENTGLYKDGAPVISVTEDFLAKHNAMPGQKVLISLTPSDAETSTAAVYIGGVLPDSQGSSMTASNWFMQQINGRDHDIDKYGVTVKDSEWFDEKGNDLFEATWTSLHNNKIHEGGEKAKAVKDLEKIKKLPWMENSYKVRGNFTKRIGPAHPMTNAGLLRANGLEKYLQTGEKSIMPVSSPLNASYASESLPHFGELPIGKYASMDVKIGEFFRKYPDGGTLFYEIDRNQSRSVKLVNNPEKMNALFAFGKEASVDMFQNAPMKLQVGRWAAEMMVEGFENKDQLDQKNIIKSLSKLLRSSYDPRSAMRSSDSDMGIQENATNTGFDGAKLKDGESDRFVPEGRVGKTLYENIAQPEFVDKNEKYSEFTEKAHEYPISKNVGLKNVVAKKTNEIIREKISFKQPGEYSLGDLKEPSKYMESKEKRALEQQLGSMVEMISRWSDKKPLHETFYQLSAGFTAQGSTQVTSKSASQVRKVVDRSALRGLYKSMTTGEQGMRGLLYKRNKEGDYVYTQASPRLVKFPYNRGNLTAEGVYRQQAIDGTILMGKAGERAHGFIAGGSVHEHTAEVFIDTANGDLPTLRLRTPDGKEFTVEAKEAFSPNEHGQKVEDWINSVAAKAQQDIPKDPKKPQDLSTRNPDTVRAMLAEALLRDPDESVGLVGEMPVGKAQRQELQSRIFYGGLKDKARAKAEAMMKPDEWKNILGELLGHSLLRKLPAKEFTEMNAIDESQKYFKTEEGSAALQKVLSTGGNEKNAEDAKVMQVIESVGKLSATVGPLVNTPHGHLLMDFASQEGVVPITTKMTEQGFQDVPVSEVVNDIANKVFTGEMGADVDPTTILFKQKSGKSKLSSILGSDHKKDRIATLESAGRFKSTIKTMMGKILHAKRDNDIAHMANKFREETGKSFGFDLENMGESEMNKHLSEMKDFLKWFAKSRGLEENTEEMVMALIDETSPHTADFLRVAIQKDMGVQSEREKQALINSYLYGISSIYRDIAKSKERIEKNRAFSEKYNDESSLWQRTRMNFEMTGNFLHDDTASAFARRFSLLKEVRNENDVYGVDYKAVVDENGQVVTQAVEKRLSDILLDHEEFATNTKGARLIGESEITIQRAEDLRYEEQRNMAMTRDALDSMIEKEDKRKEMSEEGLQRMQMSNEVLKGLAKVAYSKLGSKFEVEYIPGENEPSVNFRYEGQVIKKPDLNTILFNKIKGDPSDPLFQNMTDEAIKDGIDMFLDVKDYQAKHHIVAKRDLARLDMMVRELRANGLEGYANQVERTRDYMEKVAELSDLTARGVNRSWAMGYVPQSTRSPLALKKNLEMSITNFRQLALDMETDGRQPTQAEIDAVKSLWWLTTGKESEDMTLDGIEDLAQKLEPFKESMMQDYELQREMDEFVSGASKMKQAIQSMVGGTEQTNRSLPMTRGGSVSKNMRARMLQDVLMDGNFLQEFNSSDLEKYDEDMRSSVLQTMALGEEALYRHKMHKAGNKENVFVEREVLGKLSTMRAEHQVFDKIVGMDDLNQGNVQEGTPMMIEYKPMVWDKEQKAYVPSDRPTTIKKGYLIQGNPSKVYLYDPGAKSLVALNSQGVRGIVAGSEHRGVRNSINKRMRGVFKEYWEGGNLEAAESIIKDMGKLFHESQYDKGALEKKRMEMTKIAHGLDMAMQGLDQSWGMMGLRVVENSSRIMADMGYMGKGKILAGMSLAVAATPAMFLFGPAAAGGLLIGSGIMIGKHGVNTGKKVLENYTSSFRQVAAHQGLVKTVFRNVKDFVTKKSNRDSSLDKDVVQGIATFTSEMREDSELVGGLKSNEGRKYLKVLQEDIVKANAALHGIEADVLAINASTHLARDPELAVSIIEERLSQLSNTELLKERIDRWGLSLVNRDGHFEFVDQAGRDEFMIKQAREAQGLSFLKTIFNTGNILPKSEETAMLFLNDNLQDYLKGTGIQMGTKEWDMALNKLRKETIGEYGRETKTTFANSPLGGMLTLYSRFNRMNSRYWLSTIKDEMAVMQGAEQMGAKIGKGGIELASQAGFTLDAHGDEHLLPVDPKKHRDARGSLARRIPQSFIGVLGGLATEATFMVAASVGMQAILSSLLDDEETNETMKGIRTNPWADEALSRTLGMENGQSAMLKFAASLALNMMVTDDMMAKGYGSGALSASEVAAMRAEPMSQIGDIFFNSGAGMGYSAIMDALSSTGYMAFLELTKDSDPLSKRIHQAHLKKYADNMAYKTTGILPVMAPVYNVLQPIYEGAKAGAIGKQEGRSGSTSQLRKDLNKMLLYPVVGYDEKKEKRYEKQADRRLR